MELDHHRATAMEPVMLVSLLNMKLRNEFTDIQALCNRFAIQLPELTKKLKNIGYVYHAPLNQYRNIPL